MSASRSWRAPHTSVPRSGRTTPNVPRLALCVEEACEALGVSWDFWAEHIAPEIRMVQRTVPILAALRPELAAHKLRTGRGGDALVFGMSAEHPFDPSTVRRRAQAAWKKGGLSPIGLHEARHTFASVMIAAGVNPKVIQECMGHASITMTFDRYGHLMPSGRAEAAERVDAYLATATRGS